MLCAVCGEIDSQEGTDRESEQAAIDFNDRHRATIRYQRNENAYISASTVS